MNPQVAALIHDLRRRLREQRRKAYRQRARAEYWKARALRKGL